METCNNPIVVHGSARSRSSMVIASFASITSRNQSPFAFSQRATQNHEAFASKAVHERHVVLPSLLFPHRERRIPRWASFPCDCKILHVVVTFILFGIQGPRACHVHRMVNQGLHAPNKAHRVRQFGVSIERRFINPTRMDKEQLWIANRKVGLNFQATWFSPRRREDIA